MNEITGCLAQIFQEHPLKIILSNPRQGDFQKIVLEKRSDGYSAEKFTDKQAFHEKIAAAQLPDYCAGQLACFRQLNAWTAQVEYQIRISKKGKVLLGKNRLQEPICWRKGRSSSRWWIWGFSQKKARLSIPCMTNTAKSTGS